MSLFRISELLIFELLDLVPNLLLAVAAFPQNMRVSRRRIIIMFSLLFLSVLFRRVFVLSNEDLAAIMSVVWIALYLLFYRLCIKAGITRLLFVLLMMLNYSSFTAIICNYLTYHRLPFASEQPYSIHISLVFAVVLSISYPVIYLLFKKKVRAIIECSENQTIWRILWLIPATFCLAYYYSVFANGGLTAYSSSLNNVIFAFAFNASGLFVIFIVLCLVEDSNATIRLKDENYQLSLQFMQYEKLSAQMEDSRRAEHDLRQTARVIHSYLQSGDQSLLEEYLRQYVDTLPNETPVLFCNDPVVNALLSYYDTRAQASDIDLQINIQYNDTLPITDPDKVVLLGNLLDNALEACIRQKTADKHILFSIVPQGNALTIIVDNSFDGQVSKSKESLLSSKTGRPGIGISSSQKIVEKYGGIIRFEYQKKTFYVSCILFLKSDADHHPLNR